MSCSHTAVPNMQIAGKYSQCKLWTRAGPTGANQTQPASYLVDSSVTPGIQICKCDFIPDSETWATYHLSGGRATE